MFRSSSGPGLSINTSTANALSSQSSVPPPSGGVPGKSLFGTTTATTQPQQSTSLFGASKTTIGNSQPANQATTGGLFGNQSNQPNQPNSNSLFGGSTAQQSLPQQGGLFGSAFPQNQNPGGSNAFGGATNNQTGTSLFGNTQNAPSTQMSSLQQRAPVSVFSGSIGQQNQQHTVPGVHISVNELRPTTRFNDLHEELQRAIEYVDAFILNKIQWQEQCEAVSESMDRFCQQISPDVEHCTKNLDVVLQSLENDAESITSVKRVVQSDVADCKLNFDVINNLKLPQQFHNNNLWGTISAPQQHAGSMIDGALEGGSTRNLVEYFSNQADDLSKALASYTSNIAEVETYLKGIEASAARQTQDAGSHRDFSSSGKIEDQVRELAIVLREFENGILKVATKVGSLRENVQEAVLGPGNESNPSGVRGSRMIR